MPDMHKKSNPKLEKIKPRTNFNIPKSFKRTEFRPSTRNEDSMIDRLYNSKTYKVKKYHSGNNSRAESKDRSMDKWKTNKSRNELNFKS